MASMEEIAQRLASKRGHSVYLESIGNSSGRYKFKCADCPHSLNYYEGEFFGGTQEYDCKKKRAEDGGFC